MSYLNRYEEGDHEPVWAELSRLGAAVRQEPLRSDAMAVARATMNRVRINLERLHARLLDLGFEFARPDEALVLAKPG
ncbi:MAG: hypothetical protein JW751_13865, partial [Polyangiaceae bacterium]|nr:hypothetical protein [Polyangiaceae bacterium]